MKILNEIAPLSKNQREYLRRVKNSWFNVAEGGKRGGKNVLNTLAYCLTLENHPDRLHLIAGVSQSTASINILDCDGFGLLNYFEGRCREGKYKNKDCVYVSAVTGEKIILVAGGGKNGDERYIKGNTYGTAYITEANECAESFIKEVFDRTLSSNDRKIFHDLNPKAPQHWYYTEILDFHEQAQTKNCTYGYNYGHFTIADNLSISDEKLKKILTTYEKGTVWYDRDIKGLRKTADGIVFQDFAEHTENYIVDDVETKFKWCGVGYDLGGNKSNYALVASALGYDGVLYVLKAVEIEPQDLRIEDVEKAAQDFIESVESEYNTRVGICYVDDNYYTTINGLNDWRYIFDTAASVKGNMPLEDRPLMLSKLMAQGRFKLVKSKCEPLVFQLQNAVFDDKSEKAVILDDGSMNIDEIDGLFYSIADNYAYLT